MKVSSSNNPSKQQGEKRHHEQLDCASDTSSESEPVQKRRHKTVNEASRWTIERMKARVKQLEAHLLAGGFDIPDENYSLATAKEIQETRVPAYLGDEWKPERYEVYRATILALFQNPIFQQHNPVLEKQDIDSIINHLRDPESSAVLDSIKTKPWLVCANFQQPKLGSKRSAVLTISLASREHTSKLIPSIALTSSSPLMLARAACAVFRPEMQTAIASAGNRAGLTCSHLTGDIQSNTHIGRTNINPWMVTFESLNINKSRDVCCAAVADKVIIDAPDPSDTDAFDAASSVVLDHCCQHTPRCISVDFRHTNYASAVNAYKNEQLMEVNRQKARENGELVVRKGSLYTIDHAGAFHRKCDACGKESGARKTSGETSIWFTNHRRQSCSKRSFEDKAKHSALRKKYRAKGGK